MFNLPLTSTGRRAPARNTAATTHARVRSRGFYATLDLVPVRAELFEAAYQFVNRSSVMVLPFDVPPPTPAQLADPTDDSYLAHLFDYDDWDQVLLTHHADRARYASRLRPAARRQFDSALIQHIIPAVAAEACPGVAVKNSIKKVRLYIFREPDTKVVDAAAPRNAVGPYELCETSNGTRFYTVYGRSLTDRHRAELFERERPLPGRRRK